MWASEPGELLLALFAHGLLGIAVRVPDLGVEQGAHRFSPRRISLTIASSHGGRFVKK